MTNEAQQAASELIPKPIAEVQQVLADEVSQGREFVDIALRWLAENGISFVVNVLVALLLLAIGMVVIRVLTRTTQKALGRSGRVNALLQNFLCSVVNKTAWVLLLMIVIQRLGVNIAPLIAGLGVTGFILGFAFQESLGNLAAGMMIAINQPFQIGDYVTVGTISGTVRELNMMAATLFTADNIKVLVPNKVIWGAPITNYTATDKRRIQIAVNIAYGADISKAKRVALDVLRADPRVLDDPAPIAEVIAMGDSAVNLVLRPWTTPSDYWATFFALNQAVKEAFDREGVKIPLPQMDIRVKSSIPSGEPPSKG
ncbi:MAG: mechanosensitive ion channel family protein [Kiritimatiellae bacterium]|jgi:small conductance mechanosensitive channel|nr:mechanosensitive ion channel family protein [Kiritimatiellia bacterium]MDD3584883.1 mechanosensitive ion channel family protein [Kiritimatiellia bacterium]